jgi:GDPmannose 4,6-dehydratase
VTTAKRALITGISGQDGSYLAEFLLSKGYAVYGLERRTSAPPRRTPGVVVFEGDVTDYHSVLSAVRDVQPDEVYNLAAQSFVGTSFVTPSSTMDINAGGALNVFEACLNEVPFANVYQASTSEMFGLASKALNEASPFHPRSPYGVSKIAAHYAAKHYRDRGLDVSCGILFNHESPRRGEQFLTRKVTRYVGRLAAGYDLPPLELGDMSASRDWGFAGDYVKAMWAMLQQSEPDDYVIATGQTRTVEQFVRGAFTAGGFDYREHVVTGVGLRPTEVPYLLGDPSKAYRKFGWQAETSLGTLILKMVQADTALAWRERTDFSTV